MNAKRLKKWLCALTALILLASFAGCKPPQVKDDYAHHCTLYIDCKTILQNTDQLDPDKAELVPEDGIILDTVTVGFDDGDSVYDILVRELTSRKIHIDSSFTPVYESAYVKGIGNLYEFDCGPMSGWEYSVNGQFPNYGCSACHPQEGDAIRFLYTCDLGADLGNVYNGD